MSNDGITSRAKKTDSSIKYDSEGNIIDFGGWESEGAKLRHNLTWTPEQILNWLEEANRFNKATREGANVLRGNY
ncbi:MAG: hypothetical protein MAG551_02777 [Candidatus Scalindua arabica]|uniref:Uncharacterized protein n=1 Tax=Candidatus Scalindua arabica TaxID=1127984 RepID=A0A942A7N8_9BACT|nr:hypothetical protein [Candidatus Scalindua arabica]